MKNTQDIANAIDDLVAGLGLEKIAEDETTHPAKQEDSRSGTMPATEGERSAENSADVKAESTGQSIDAAKPSEASTDVAPSAVEAVTSAAMTGETPAVEDGYKDKPEDSETSHPATTDNGEKYASEDLEKLAKAVVAEAQQIEKNTIKSASDATESLPELLKAAGAEGTSVEDAVTEYVRGYAKSAGLVAELTADYLDSVAAGLLKNAEEGMEGTEGMDGMTEDELLAQIPPELLMEGAVPAEAMGGEGEAVDAEAEALADAAVEIAAELGVEPEAILEAAMAEAEGEGGGEEGAVEDMVEATPEAAPDMEPSEEEIKEAMHKAAVYDQLLAEFSQEAHKKEAAEALETSISTALRNIIEKGKSQDGE